MDNFWVTPTGALRDIGGFTHEYWIKMATDEAISWRRALQLGWARGYRGKAGEGGLVIHAETRPWAAQQARRVVAQFEEGRGRPTDVWLAWESPQRGDAHVRTTMLENPSLFRPQPLPVVRRQYHEARIGREPEHVKRWRMLRLKDGSLLRLAITPEGKSVAVARLYPVE